MNILFASRKPFDRALADLQDSAAPHGFSFPHVQALSDTLAEKGQPIDKRGAMPGVCNAGIASRMLARYATISWALPCRVAVFDGGTSKRLGTITSTSILTGFGVKVADVERTLPQILAGAA
ncbi:MAG TPA: DUF302 domain-containing protein [Burkholderiaceae bacterium]|nr:DUF302 domain-containing protein [Burkholderiaceae bacterium]